MKIDHLNYIKYRRKIPIFILNNRHQEPFTFTTPVFLSKNIRNFKDKEDDREVNGQSAACTWWYFFLDTNLLWFFGILIFGTTWSFYFKFIHSFVWRLVHSRNEEVYLKSHDLAILLQSQQIYFLFLVISKPVGRYLVILASKSLKSTVIVARDKKWRINWITICYKN